MAASFDPVRTVARPGLKGPGPRRYNTGSGQRLAMAVPGFVLYAALVLLPLILSIYYSFTNRNLLYPKSATVGFNNYKALLTNSAFLSSFGFTIALTVITLIVVNAVGLAIGLLLNKVGRFFNLMRSVFFIPAALSGVIVAFIWSTILTDNGLLNSVLNGVGLGALVRSWFGNPITAQGSVIAVTSWQELGLCIVVYLAGLQTIPHELVDAARVDGCGSIAVFRTVTWPLLASSLTINTTLLLINGFKTYDIPTVLTGTGPGGSSATVATEVIRVGFTLDRVGSASAMSVVLLVIVALMTFIAISFLRRREL